MNRMKMKNQYGPGPGPGPGPSCGYIAPHLIKDFNRNRGPRKLRPNKVKVSYKYTDCVGVARKRTITIPQFNSIESLVHHMGEESVLAIVNNQIKLDLITLNRSKAVKESWNRRENETKKRAQQLKDYLLKHHNVRLKDSENGGASE